MKPSVRQEDAVTTYRYVRLALVALVVFLAASIGNTHQHAYRHDDGWQTSISAYFYTNSHSVFVASLCAVGICLIVYQGRTTTEDVLLNFSGLLAFVVGLVPTAREALRGPGLPCEFDTALFAENSMWALLFASVIAGVTIVIIQGRSWLRGLGQPDGRLMRLVETLLACALLAALIVGAVYFVQDRSAFIEKAHGIAAFTMFGGIIAVVVHYACYAARRRHRRRLFVLGYAGLAVLMVGTVLLAAWFHVFGGSDRPTYGIIIVEALVIFEFALFWVIQSVDLWKLEKDEYWMGSLSEVLTAHSEGAAQESR